MALSNSTGRLAPQSMLRDRYIVLGLAGRGGMGCVYKAIDTLDNNRLVAIKEMSQASLSPEKLAEAEERFRLEADMLGKLSHPNLPCVLDSFASSGRSYLVMDFIDGKTLLQLLSESPEQQLPVEQVLHYAIQLCLVLEYLHHQSPPIVFRDLKPSNVMVTAHGEVYLIDFGIARHFTQGKQQDTIPLGSEGFCPPEQFGTGQTSPRSDLYSLGATLYYSLTGKNPRSNKPTLFDFSPLTEFNQQIPGDLNKLVLWLVATREEQRPQSATQVRQILQSVEQWTTASTNSTGGRKSKTLPLSKMNSEQFYDTKTARAAQSRQWLGQFNVLPGRVGNWCTLVLIPWLALTYGQVETWLLLLALPVFQHVREGGDRFFRCITEKDEGQSLLLARVLTSPTWTPYFVLLFLMLPLLLISGCFYLLVDVQTAPSFVLLCLGLFLLLLTLLCFTCTRIHSTYTKKILISLILALILLNLTLLSLPSVQMVLRTITPNNLLSATLLGLAFLSFLRPHRRFAWVDHLSLTLTIGIYTLLQYCYGTQALALLGEPMASVVNNILVGILGGIALTMALRLRYPFTWGERVLVCVISCLCLGLQYTFGLQEIAHAPLITSLLQIVSVDPLDLVSLNILLAIGPLLLSLSWLFLPPIQRSVRLTRVPFLVLALTGAGLQNLLGSSPSLPPFFVLNSPFALPLASLLNLAQVLACFLLLLAILLATRLARRFRWLDHSAIFSVSLTCALLQSTAWDKPIHLSALDGRATALLSSSIVTLNQPQFYTAAYNKLLAQGLMFVVLCSLCLVALLYLRYLLGFVVRFQLVFERQRRFWIGAHQLLHRLEQALLLVVTLTCLLLYWFFGESNSILRLSLGQLTLGRFLLFFLFVGILVALIRVAQPKKGHFERLLIQLDALACALLLWRDPLDISPLQAVQGWNIGLSLPSSLIIFCLVGMAFSSFFWLKLPCTSWTRKILLGFSLVALLCTLLQALSPILVLMALVLIAEGLILAVQMER